MTTFSRTHPRNHPHLNTDDLPARLNQPEATPGRCNNLDYCSIGMQRVLVQVPLGDSFTCPECGNPLRPPVTPLTVRKAVVMPVLRLAVLILGMTLSLGFGFSLGQVQPVAERALDRVSKAALTAVAPPAAALPPPTIKPALRPEPPPVQEQSFPRSASAESAAPKRLQHEMRFGQVTIDCALDRSATQPVCRVADLRGGDAFSAEALAWLQQRHVRYAPALRGGAPVMLDHRWRIQFQDYSGTEKTAVE